MSEQCTHDCSTCGADCSSRGQSDGGNSEWVSGNNQLNEFAQVRRVIGVVSGKGGVGKSLITSMLSVLLNRRGYMTAILDADVTGPSIPKAFGIHQKANNTDIGLFPVSSKSGIQLMSVNLLLPNEDDPVVWRGPVISGMIQQFWSNVLWHKVDYMFVDMPPGTGDVPLTVFQSIPVDGIIIVTSPQELVSMIVSKAVKMAELMNVPILGIVENYSYIKCPDCGKEIKMFGDSHIEQVAEAHGLSVLGRLPVDPKLAAACDEGLIELFDADYLDHTADVVEALKDAPERVLPPLDDQQ